MSVSVKKIRLIPVGDKDEVNRVYNYIRNGMYAQYRILNTYMSQVGTLYYSCNRNTKTKDFTEGFEQIFSDTEAAYNNLSYMEFGDYLRNMEADYKKHMKDLKSAEYKADFNAIFRNTNEAIWDIEQAKGLGMAGNAGMRVKQDFSTALKNGLARGERNLPFYKRDFPLLVPSRFLTLYTEDEDYTNEETGETGTRTNYYIKFVNGIVFKMIISPKARKDYYLLPLLDSIIHDPEHYSIGGSSIAVVKNKIILNLTTKVTTSGQKYTPVEGRVMGLSMGYDKCLVAALSDSNKMFEIGDDYKDSLVERRIRLQKDRERRQRNAKGPGAGNAHGRKRKMLSADKFGRRETNIVRYYNHMLSKAVIRFAKKHKVEAIVIEEVKSEDLKNHPTMLRNWSYYQLQEYITYKAGSDIKVIVSNHVKDARKVCYNCGKEFEEKDVIPQKIEWTGSISFNCPNCAKKIEYSFNKAKNMAKMG